MIRQTGRDPIGRMKRERRLAGLFLVGALVVAALAQLAGGCLLEEPKEPPSTEQVTQ